LVKVGEAKNKKELAEIGGNMQHASNMEGWMPITRNKLQGLKLQMS